MEVRFTITHPDAVVPVYAKDGDAGLDLVATSMEITVNENPALSFWDGESPLPESLLEQSLFYEYGTGICIEIPPGFLGLVLPRSSISKTGLILANSVGLIDSGYRGEIKLRFKKVPGDIYKIGDKIGQLVILPYPKIELVFAESLNESQRGSGGFGSTGK